jgi:hypothetical protein
MVGLGIYIFIAKSLSSTVDLTVAMVAVEGT